ncbi:MAG: hypothetical protein WBD65_08380 [Methylocella sp.]
MLTGSARHGEFRASIRRARFPGRIEVVTPDVPEPPPLGRVRHQNLTTATIHLDQLKVALMALVMPLKDLSRRLT